MTFPNRIRIQVITLSDRASRGVYPDLSGPAISGMVEAFFKAKEIAIEVQNVILPDDPAQLREQIENGKMEGLHVIFTTGGTGLGPRDFTPEVVRPLLDKEIPGIMEMIRVKHGLNKPAALVSRSIAGVAGSTLIYCLPGSVKAVEEYCLDILPTIIHSLRMILGIDDHRS
ncbi:MAG: MogA/MoaB family molybdenum cofactor biosynthesis protein [Bacteroidales bacterium]